MDSFTYRRNNKISKETKNKYTSTSDLDSSSRAAIQNNCSNNKPTISLESRSSNETKFMNSIEGCGKSEIRSLRKDDGCDKNNYNCSKYFTKKY